MFENPWNSRKLNLQELGPAGQKGQGEEQEHPMLGADSVWEKDFAAGYDMCIVFPAVDGEFTEVGNSYIDIMKKLDLDMFAYRGVRGREIFVLARVPLPKLRAFADKVDIRMKLDGTIAQQMLEKGNIEAGIGPVIIPHRPDICPFQPYEHLFGKYDRATPQDLYYHTPGNNDPFAQVRLKLCELLLESESADGTAGLKFRLHLRHGTLLGVFPLHDKTQTQALGAQWARFPQAELPLHYIKEYFGEKLGIYFSFLQFYSTSLLWPAAIGVPIQIAIWSTGDTSGWYLPLFAFFVAMWSVVFLELWKRREKTLANEWGMVDFRVAEEDRQEFRGGWIESPVDGSPVRFYPSYKRNKHLRQHYAIVLALVTLVLGVVISIYIARFALTPVVGFDVAKIIASIANAASIQIMNLLFSLVTHDLTERENHRTETEFEDSMITKIFMFQFVNSYASYFYLAFVGQFMGDCPHGCMPALGQDLAIILASRLVVGNIVEVAIPYYGWERKHRQVAEWEGKISRPEQEHLLDEYKQTKHSLRDYAETAIGFGYASLFVCSLPISALVLLLASVVEIRMDGWKLLHLHQRPFPRGCEDIGAWQDIFLLLSGIAVVTNAGLVAFTMTTLDTLPIYMRWGIFALFQWVCFALQGLIMAVIPDVPEEIDIQQQRMAFVVRKLIDRVADDNDEDEAGIEDPLEIGQYPDYGGRYASKVAVPEGATHKWRQL